ncbi:MAG: hypothetical protein R8K48_03770 [Gallionella sp.]
MNKLLSVLIAAVFATASLTAVAAEGAFSYNGTQLKRHVKHEKAERHDRHHKMHEKREKAEHHEKAERHEKHDD